MESDGSDVLDKNRAARGGLLNQIFAQGDKVIGLRSLAPKVAGYVTAVEVEDNQAVRAGDVLFRIDDRDYRARLAQAAANVEAAEARLTNVDADIQLQRALIRQAEAQKRSSVAEMNLATKSSDRRRELIRTSAVSQAQVDESDAALSEPGRDRLWDVVPVLQPQRLLDHPLRVAGRVPRHRCQVAHDRCRHCQRHHHPQRA